MNNETDANHGRLFGPTPDTARLGLGASSRKVTEAQEELLRAIGNNVAGPRFMNEIYAARAWPASPTKRKIAVIKELLKAGAILEARDDAGKRPYDWLTVWESMEREVEYREIRRILDGK